MIQVLLIEDNPGDARLVEDALGRRAGAVEWVTTLADGVRRLAEDRFDVVLLDLMLPDGDGLETLTRLRSVEQATPIVVLSQAGEDDFGLRAVEAGAEDFVSKDGPSLDVLDRVIRYSIERHRARLAIERDAQAMSEYIAQAAHDLRSPVSVLAGLAETVASRRADPADLEEILAAMTRQADRLYALSEQILDRSRFRAIPAHLETVSLADAVTEALEAQPRRDDVRVEVGPLVGMAVQADGVRLQRILGNVLGNAIRYAESRVGVEARRSEEWAVVEFSDDGPGVDPVVLESLFSAFSRGTDRGGGAGLGLAIARELAQSMGGEVRYSGSGPLGGASFEVSLVTA